MILSTTIASRSPDSWRIPSSKLKKKLINLTNPPINLSQSTLPNQSSKPLLRNRLSQLNLKKLLLLPNLPKRRKMTLIWRR